jgi:hypothetical protein
MTLEEFRKSLSSQRPPEDLTLPLAALWWDAKGDWTKAHESAQRDEGAAGAWVHAYLHRKEGICQMPGTGIGRQESLKPTWRSRKSGDRQFPARSKASTKMTKK